MRVAERYKTNAKYRKLIKILSTIQVAYICLRTFWNLIPVALAHNSISWADVGIFLVGVLLYPLYQYAFGFGRSQYEKVWAMKAYAILSILLIGECFVRFWLYHVMFGPNAIDPEISAEYPRIPKSIMRFLGVAYDTPTPSILYATLDVFEKAMDVAGMGACAIGMFILKEYVSSQKEASIKSKNQ